MLKVLLVAIAAEAFAFLGYEFWRLALDRAVMGGVDLANQVLATHNWFTGTPVYGHVISAIYPPASYALLWPFIGWLQFGATRWLWAVLSVGSLVYLAIVVLRETGVRGSLERGIVVVVLLAIYPIGQTTGNGQVGVCVVALLVYALLSLQRSRSGIGSDLVVALCLLLALVKPTVSVPFLVVAFLATCRKRPVLLAVGAYAGLTLLAGSYQPEGLIALIQHWLKVSAAQAAAHGPIYYADVPAWLGTAGLKHWNLPASAAILTALGYWTWRHRRIDLWLLLGVAGYASRFWAYHQSYDDIVILFPMVALFRVATLNVEDRGRQVTASLLLAATVALMLVPSGLYVLPGSFLRALFTTLETVIWLVGLGFLLAQARSARVVSDREPGASRREVSLQGAAISANGRPIGGPTLSILMPVYNEQASVERAIDGVLAAPLPVDFELLVVDDGSTDRTAAVLAAREWPANMHVLSHERNQGKGAAIRTALAEAHGEFTSIFDADLECDPAGLTRLLEPLTAGQTNVVFGARVFDGHTRHSLGFFLGNRGVTLATNVLFRGRVSDMMTCQKMMRTDLFRSLPLREQRFGIEPEITARILQRRETIINVPVSYQARTKAEGKKIAARDGWRVLGTLLRCRVTRAQRGRPGKMSERLADPGALATSESLGSR